MEKPSLNPESSKQSQNLTNFEELDQARALGLINNQEEYDYHKQKLLKEAGLSEVQEAYELGMINADEYRLRMGSLLGNESAHVDEVNQVANGGEQSEGSVEQEYKTLLQRAKEIAAYVQESAKMMAGDELTSEQEVQRQKFNMVISEFMEEVAESNLSDDQKRDLYQSAKINIPEVISRKYADNASESEKSDSQVQEKNENTEPVDVEPIDITSEVKEFDTYEQYLIKKIEEGIAPGMTDEVLVSKHKSFTKAIDQAMTEGLIDEETADRLKEEVVLKIMAIKNAQIDKSRPEFGDDRKRVSSESKSLTPREHLNNYLESLKAEVKVIVKRHAAFIAALLVTASGVGLMSLVNRANKVDNGSRPVASEDINDRDQSSETSTGSQASDEDNQSKAEQSSQATDPFERWDAMYESYERGENRVVKYDAELFRKITANKPELNMFNEIRSIEDLKKAAFVSPEVTISLLSKINKAPAYYMDKNGNLAIAKTAEQHSKAIADSKAYPTVFTENYKSFLEIVKEGEGDVYEKYFAPKTFNTYTVTINRSTGETALAYGQGDGGEAIAFKIKDGEKIKEIAFIKGCANLVVMVIDEGGILIPRITIIPPGPDPDPGGGTSDETPDGETPDGETPDGETPDGETPDGETPDGETPGGETPGGGGTTLLDHKDFSKLSDANDVVKSDGKASGNDLQQAGDLKDGVRSTKGTVGQQNTEQKSGRREIDEVTKYQAEQNLQAEADQIQESLQQLNSESDSVIMSENLSAETAAQQSYEQVVAGAGSDEAGIEGRINRENLYNDLSKLRNEGVPPENIQITVDPDGMLRLKEIKKDDGMNSGMVEMP